jgi:DNA-binding FadR family transcriptional regulator
MIGSHTIRTSDILAARGANHVSDSAATRVARHLALDILGEKLKPGDKLPQEEELLARFGISRTVLREALKTLTAKGLLVSKTRTGTTVRDKQSWNFFDADILAWRIDVGLDEAFLQYLREARLAVEPFAARLAAERASAPELEEMRQAVVGVRDALDDRQLFALADLRFHRAVAAASGNFVLSSFAAVIETALVCSTLLLPLEKIRLRSEAVALHQDLLDAIEARKPDVAGQLMFDMISFGAKVGEPAGAAE